MRSRFFTKKTAISLAAIFGTASLFKKNHINLNKHQDNEAYQRYAENIQRRAKDFCDSMGGCSPAKRSSIEELIEWDERTNPHGYHPK